MNPKDQFFKKAAHYCAVEERCIDDVKNKLIHWGALPDVVDYVINKLIEEDFINESRYASIFAASKLRSQKWGKKKIIWKLIQKKVDRKYIDAAIAELSENVYKEVLWSLAVQKWESIHSNDDPGSKKAKLLRYLASRGFEEELIWTIIKKFESNYLH